MSEINSNISKLLGLLDIQEKKINELYTNLQETKNQNRAPTQQINIATLMEKISKELSEKLERITT